MRAFAHGKYCAPLMSDHAYLTPRSGSTYQGQHGEDRWLELFLGNRRDGFYLEVGAYDGVVISNTYHFEQIGWSGVLVEPDPRKAAACRANRPGSRIYACAAVGDRTQQTVAFNRV